MYPQSRNLIIEYSNFLFKLKRYTQIVELIKNKLMIIEPDSEMYSILSKAYFEMNNKFLHHIYQSKSYILMGAISAAIEQLDYAIKYTKKGEADYLSTKYKIRELRNNHVVK